MRWRVRLSEFDFDVLYKKGALNTQADGLLCLGMTTEAVYTAELHITCFMVAVLDDGAEILTDDLCDDIFVAKPSEPPAGSFVPITHEDMIREQQSGSFCTQIRSQLKGGHQTPFLVYDQEYLVRLIECQTQIVVPHALQQRILHLSHFSEVGAHPGERKLYLTLRRDFYWPTTAFDCYAVRCSCMDSIKNDVKLRKHSKKVPLILTWARLEFIAVDILKERIRTPQGHGYLLLITDQFSKLVRTIPLKRITTRVMARAIFNHWVFSTAHCYSSKL